MKNDYEIISAWDMEKLEMMFSPGDVEDIKHIVVVVGGGEHARLYCMELHQEGASSLSSPPTTSA